MKNELREIQKKVRLAAQKKQAEEKQKKIEIKKKSEQHLIEEKKKLEEEINKKRIDYSLFFIIPLAILTLFFAIYTIFQIYEINNPTDESWQSPKINNEDIQKAQNELTNILMLISKRKKIENFIYYKIPDTWKKKIVNELCSDSPSWQIENVSLDKFKRGKNPILLCSLKNQKGEQVGLMLIKEDKTIYLYKIEQITGQVNNEKK